MAVLEFEFKGIDQNFRSSASNVLNDIDKIKKAFGSIGLGIGVDLKTALDGQKVALNDTKIQTQELVKAGKELDNQNKQTRNSIAELTLEQKKLTAEQRASRANLQDSPYSRLSRELNEMRNEAKNLGAQMILLYNAGMKTSLTYNTLENRFKQVQKETLNLDNSIKKLDSDLGQNNRSVGAYGNALGGLQQKMSGANGVTMEFNRIIQDAPFGMMGIGNNIQQLTASWASYAQQQRTAADGTKIAVSNMTLLRGAIANTFSGFNLFALAISAVTSAWVIYDREQQKASKAIKEAKDKTQEYKESLTGLQAIQVASISNYTTEISKLDTLVRITTDTSNSTKQRSYALKQLQDMYPQVFKNLDLESVKNVAASTSYLQLRDSILSAARAQAVYSRQAKLAEELLTLEYKKNQQEKEKSDAQRAEGLKNSIRNAQTPLERFRLNVQEDLYALPSALGSPIESIKGIFSKPVTEVTKINDELDITNKRIDEIKSEQTDLTNKAIEYQKGITEAQNPIKNVSNSTKNTSSNLKEAYGYLAQIKDLVSGKQKDIDLINVDGQQKDLIELEYKWESYFNKIADLNNKLQKDIKSKSISSAEAEKVKKGLRTAGGMGNDLMLSERAEILKKYQGIRLEIIRKANEEAGVFEQQSRETDLARQKIWLDEKLKELVENGADIKQAMEDMLPADLMRTYNINIKWNDKDLEEWGKLNDKIQETIDKPFSGQNQKSNQDELEKRIAMLKKLLEQLSRATGQPFDQAEFDRLSTELKNKSTEKYNTEQAKKDIQDYVTIANNSIKSLFTNLETNINEFGLDFNSVLFSASDTLKSMFDSINSKNNSDFITKLTEVNKNTGLIDVKENWKSIKNDTVEMSKAIGSAMGMVGNLVSNLSKSTSGVGQGVGGALSGAGAGLSIGTMLKDTLGKNGGLIGAGIGAVVGLVGGILGAKKARKQERLQQQQLEEQKKANALLERMNALTYASQIIGQKTEYGIVSGVRRNEFGQIVSVVQGQDIIMVADRTNKQKGR